MAKRRTFARVQAPGSSRNAERQENQRAALPRISTGTRCDIGLEGAVSRTRTRDICHPQEPQRRPGADGRDGASSRSRPVESGATDSETSLRPVSMHKIMSNTIVISIQRTSYLLSAIVSRVVKDLLYVAHKARQSRARSWGCLCMGQPLCAVALVFRRPLPRSRIKSNEPARSVVLQRQGRGLRRQGSRLAQHCLLLREQMLGLFADLLQQQHGRPFDQHAHYYYNRR
jgi:hypothetical protein